MATTLFQPHVIIGPRTDDPQPRNWQVPSNPPAAGPQDPVEHGAPPAERRAVPGPVDDSMTAYVDWRVEVLGLIRPLM